ncbi:MAG: T9SS type A sorting domain-containing protein [Bacteroidales bacterium]|nr:T9SS type A sorting domain-containing protein [Bacteroidales bacterium]
MLRQEIGDKESINVSRFVAGIYIYTVEFEGRKSTGKLIIN